ncbi:16728_t:CDS:2, partial [Acaulospora colombiana]
MSASTPAGNETVALEKYDAEKLISFLREKDLENNDVTGRAFLEMTKHDFRDINLKAGPALVLANFAKECKKERLPYSKPSKLNLDFYNTIPLENWSCNKLVEHYRENLEKSGNWKTSPKKFNMDLKRDYSQFKIDTLQVKQQMIATGNASTQIVDNRKLLRDDNGEAVKISSSDDDIHADIKSWSPDHVKKFLKSRMENSDYDETEIEKIRNQDLTGKAFLRLTEEKLTRKPGLYELKSSPAEGVMELVEELNEKL